MHIHCYSNLHMYMPRITLQFTHSIILLYANITLCNMPVIILYITHMVKHCVTMCYMTRVCGSHHAVTHFKMRGLAKVSISEVSFSTTENMNLGPKHFTKVSKSDGPLEVDLLCSPGEVEDAPPTSVIPLGFNGWYSSTSALKGDKGILSSRPGSKLH